MSNTEFKISTPDGFIHGRQSDGGGMPVVLLHGSGASSAVFDRQFASPLGEIYRLVALDLPGHGQSSDARHPEQTYSINGMADAVLNALDALGVSAPVVHGWSMGGHIAIELAARLPDLAGLALTGTPPVSRGPVGALRGFHASWDILLASKEVFSHKDAERFMHFCFGDAGTPDILREIERTDGRLRPIFLRSLMRGDGVDQRREVEANPVPLAMIDGAHDPIVRRGYLEHLSYANLWQDRCHVIADAGHAPFLQQPKAFNALLHRFLKDVALERQRPGHTHVRRRA